MENYKKLEQKFAEVTALHQVLKLLDWDRSVMMPERGGAQRARQIGVVTAQAHKIQSAPEIGALIAKVDVRTLDAWQKANLDLMETSHRQALAMPGDIIEKKALQDVRTEESWAKAKAANDFKMVLPDLEKSVGLTRAYAEAKAEKLGVSPYETLMDSFLPYRRHVPGVSPAELDALFDDYAAFLPDFLSGVLSRWKEPLPLDGLYPVPRQEALCRTLAEKLGFDFTRGRLDTSSHPFSMGLGDDVRITSRYREDSFLPAMQVLAHEVGHGLYNRYTPQEWQDQPVGVSQYMGMGVHESQSLSLDHQLARTREYWEAMAPLVQKAFGVSGPAYAGENLFLHAIRPNRGVIRVEANQVTYVAHIIVRYRLERDLVERRLEPRDLPEAWRAQMQKVIGVTPADDRTGCLQDIHWYAGDFGYFPAYAVGALMAAQFVGKMKADLPFVMQDVARGDFSTYTGWLRENVHAKGCLHRAPDLVEKVTGAKLSAGPLKTHLKNLYGDTTCSPTSAPAEKRRV